MLRHVMANPCLHLWITHRDQPVSQSKAGFRALKPPLLRGLSRHLPGLMTPSGCPSGCWFHYRCGGSAGLKPASQFSAAKLRYPGLRIRCFEAAP